MLKQLKWLMVLAMGCSLCLGSLSVAVGKNVSPSSSAMPLVKMENWKNSTEQEKMSFLYGFLSMVELERIWQQEKPAPLSKSLVAAWGLGFEGLTAEEVSKGLTAYAVEHPEALDKHVLEVMWFMYVQPKLTPAMQKEVAKAKVKAGLAK